MISTNLILHPYESSHILTTHHLLIDLTNCVSCCLEFFVGGGDDHPTILGREYMVTWASLQWLYISESPSYTTIWKQLELGLHGNLIENCNHTSNRFDLTIPLQQVIWCAWRLVCQSYTLPLGGIQELQCLVSSELISLCPAVVDTPFKSSFQAASAEKTWTVGTRRSMKICNLRKGFAWNPTCPCNP